MSDTIQKKILLEPSIHRLGESEYYKWGKEPDDLIFTEKVLSCSDEIYVDNLRVRYRTMIEWFSFLVEFIRNCKYYKIVKIRDTKKRIEFEMDFFDLSKKIDYFFENIPYENYDFGTDSCVIICVNEKYNEFQNKFINREKAIKFYEQIENILKSKYDGNVERDSQYINLPLYLESDINDFGIFHEVSIKEYVDTETYTVKGKKESLLLTLQRRKQTVDENSNIAPFILNENNEVELKYSVGVINIKNDGNDTLCDVITKIVFENLSGETYQYYNYGNIVFNETLETCKYIHFTYIIDAKFSNNNYVLNTGIQHEETYTFNTKIFNFFIDKENYVEYFYPEINMVLENGSDITFKTCDLIPSEYEFLDNATIEGVTDCDIDIDNIFVTRGKSNVFERRSILSEVKTFDDLEKYKNDYFHLKEQKQ